MREAARPLLALAAVLATACGGSPPREAHTDAVASIRAAETAGAEEEPDASLHLELAREALEAAETAMEDGDDDRARRALARASADAELAVALAQLEDAREDAEQTRQRIQEMRARNR